MKCFVLSCHSPQILKVKAYTGGSILAQIMTTKEVAKYLKLHPITICKLSKEGKIPSVQIGRVWRFDKEVIDEWIANGQIFFFPSFNPKKGPSYEETTQNPLRMLPMGRGCSVGSLKYHGEKGCLYNSLRLRVLLPSYQNLSLCSYLSASSYYPSKIYLNLKLEK